MAAIPPTHRRAAILSIGDELTLGQTLDTNSQWLSQQLLELGIVTVLHMTVPDDLDAHVRALKMIAEGGDIGVVISSGGLGPTEDALTRHAVAKATDDTLIEDAESLRTLEAFFAARKRIMNPKNRVQAMRPSRATVLPNPHGTAPGFAAKIGEIDCFCAPGPPNELFPMFREHIVPKLRPVPGITVRTRTVGTVGIAESDIASRLGAMMDRTHVPLVGTTASGGLVTCRVRYEGLLPAGEADRLMDAAAEQISELLAPHVFSTSHNSLPLAIIEFLKQRNETIAVVESCTGGMLGAALTDIPGSSAAFVGGLLTYTNDMKTHLAQVPASTFKSEGDMDAPGAVSDACAIAMATGGKLQTCATYCLSITGIAGPDGGTADKPVGTVWIGLAGPKPSTARRFLMAGNRQTVRTLSVTNALAMLWLHLQGRDDVILLREQR